MSDVTAPLPTRASRLRGPIGTAALLLIGIWATWWLFLRSERGQMIDDVALAGEPGWFYSLTSPVLTVISGVVIVLAGIVLIAAAVIQRRYAIAIAAAVLYVGPNITTQLIKGTLDRPDYSTVVSYGNSWPSGHTTAAIVISLTALLVLPVRWRGPVALLGAAYTVLTGWGTVVAGWHRPSDVVGAILVAGAWYGVVETVRRSFASQFLVTAPTTTDARRSVRILDICAGLGAAVGVGILAAIALSLPSNGVAPVNSDLPQWALIGSLCGIAAIVAGVHRLVLTIGPHQ